MWRNLTFRKWSEECEQFVLLTKGSDEYKLVGYEYHNLYIKLLEYKLSIQIELSTQYKVNYTSLTSEIYESIIHPYKIIMINNIKYII